MVTMAQEEAPISSSPEKGRALPVLEGTVCTEPSVCRSELSEEPRTELSPITQSEDEEKQFMREILLGEALDRADRKAYETVVQTPDSGLETLWRDFLERDAQSSCSFLEKIGLIGVAPDDPPPEEEWPELFEPAAIELLEN